MATLLRVSCIVAAVAVLLWSVGLRGVCTCVGGCGAQVELDRGTVRATQLKALRKRFSKHSAAAGAGGRQAHAHTIAGEPSASPVHAAPRHRRNGSNGRGGGGSKDPHGRTAPPRHGGPRPSSAAPSHARHPSHGDDHSVASTASSHSSHRPRVCLAWGCSRVVARTVRFSTLPLCTILCSCISLTQCLLFPESAPRHRATLSDRQVGHRWVTRQPRQLRD